MLVSLFLRIFENEYQLHFHNHKFIVFIGTHVGPLSHD